MHASRLLRKDDYNSYEYEYSYEVFVTRNSYEHLVCTTYARMWHRLYGKCLEKPVHTLYYPYPYRIMQCTSA